MNDTEHSTTATEITPASNSIPPVTVTSPTYNEEKEHYKSLISLFKTCLGVIAGVATIIAILTFRDRADMRAQMKDTVDDMKSRMADAEKDMERKFNNIHSETVLLNTRAQFEISSIKTDAQNEISRVKSLAMTEARKAINQVFSERKFDQFVEQVAKERMEPQITSLVDDRIELDRQKEVKKVDSAIHTLSGGNTREAEKAYNYLSVNLPKINETQTDKLLENAKRINFTDNVNLSADQYVISLVFLINSQPVYDFAKGIVLSNFTKHDLNDVLYNRAFEYIISSTRAENFDLFKKMILGFRDGGMFRTITMAIAELPDQRNIDILLKILNFKEGVDYVISRHTMADVKGLTVDIMHQLQSKIPQEKLDETYYFKRSK